jgi:hypothetical protein
LVGDLCVQRHDQAGALLHDRGGLRGILNGIPDASEWVCAHQLISGSKSRLRLVVRRATVRHLVELKGRAENRLHVDLIIGIDRAWHSLENNG